MNYYHQRHGWTWTYAESSMHIRSVSSILSRRMKTSAYQFDLVGRKSFIDSLVRINFIYFTLHEKHCDIVISNDC